VSSPLQLLNLLRGGKILLFALILSCAGLPDLSAQPFSWKMEVAKIIPGGQPEALPFNRVIRMRNDDTFELRLAVQAYCFCYIIIRSSGGDLTVLNDTPLRAGTRRVWSVKLESPPGSETVYVVMTAARQAGLEKTIRAYKENPKAENADGVYHEVLKIQSAGMKGKERPPETSISGVAVRGDFEVEYYDSDRYVRTITVRH
jgi:hypothetical protein